ncbi:fibronectin type III domain-containing protein [Parapedobacter tibetensis]|uniref:fibronectin type III domain-containing protein n=1 Tax=Parapedobacter tibetensis TaxID=2972951 RepID=UPI00214D74CA|nr:fibronectin type III domain-containing protein [Parapedobacter tibetensis]
MRRPKLKTNYGYLSDADLARLATRTADALRTSTGFPDLHPTFAEYEAVALDYIAKQGITAKGGSIQQNQEKDEAREALIVMMRRVTSYINNFTDISSIQLGSGFYAVEPPSALLAAETVDWIKFRDGRLPGEVILDWAAVKAAAEYEYTIADGLDADGQPIWGEIRRIRRSKGNIITGLENRLEYYARVRSRNIKGESAWSPIATVFTRW